MKSITVEFTYLDDFDDEFTVTAKVIPGGSAPFIPFDRFQEPDEDSTVEIISVFNQSGDNYSEYMYQTNQIFKIEDMAIEKANEQGPDENDEF